MKFRRSVDSQDGASLLELALILPFLAILIVGIVQCGYLFAANIVLRQAAVTAAREGLLSLPPRSDDEIRDIARFAIQPMLAPANLRQINLDRNAFVNGSAGAFEIELVYDVRSFVPGILNGSGPGGAFELRVLYTVR